HQSTDAELPVRRQSQPRETRLGKIEQGQERRRQVPEHHPEHLAPPFLALLDFAKSCFARLRLPAYWQLGIGGLVVGVISIFVPQVWGNGYSVVGSILHGQLVGVWLLSVLVAKVVATSATVGSRAVGGVFTPTLFIGCAVGALFGGLLH